jgi:phosphoribosylformylglycinamidine synthase
LPARLVESAHDVSDGGLFVTLLESAMPGELGFDISTDESIRKDAFLFGESQSRIVVSVSAANQDEFINQLLNEEVEFSLLGEVTDATIVIDGDDWGNVTGWKNNYDEALGEEMKREKEISIS